jgi:hypothetical protein
LREQEGDLDQSELELFAWELIALGQEQTGRIILFCPVFLEYPRLKFT